MTLLEIQECIRAEKWDEAKTMLREYKGISDHLNDLFFVYEAYLHINEGQYDDAMSSISKGIGYNFQNYELYFLLGNVKEKLGKFAQALFAYENAVLLSAGSEDNEFLTDYLRKYKERHEQLPGKTAIIIVSYENLEYTKICVDSIRAYNLKNSYEIIVIDNHSTDGTNEWLTSQSDIKYIINEENRGFPAACNQGILIAEQGSDIFLLNNDTVIMPNSLFCLRMGLYEEDSIGITGSVSNRVSNNQMITESFPTLEDYFTYCTKNNIYDSSRNEYRIKLIGFAMLFKRAVINSVGLLDENFGLGHYEDDDICIRTLQKGYRIKLCKDSFIYHFGNRSFIKNKQNDLKKHQAGILKNRAYIISKWGLDINYYSIIRDDIIPLIDRKPKDSFRILEIGCGCGATLLKIQSIYKNAEVFGAELNEYAVNIGKSNLNLIQSNIEDKSLPYPEKYFDYILFGDVLEHLHDPADILVYMKKYLKPDGYVLASIPNLMNHSVMLPLLKGRFSYTDSGILDNTHLRFFTREEIVKMFLQTGYDVECIFGKPNVINEETLDFIHKLALLDSDIDEEEFKIYQYIVLSKLNS